MSSRNLSMLLCLVLCAGPLAVLPARAEPPTGRTSQGLRTDNPPVSDFDRERFGLIELSNAQSRSFCSGALLTNLWVITAAHCVEDRNGGRLGVPGVIGITGNWRSTQTHTAVEILNFRPIDIALIRLDAPMRVLGSERRMNAMIWRLADGDLTAHGVRVYGMGRSEFATDATHPAPDPYGIYRWFDITVQNVGSQSYSFPATLGQSVLGGDSGGPSFFDNQITGVHSLDTVHCANKQPSCDWNMVDNAYETWDARVSLVANQIDAAIQRTAPPNLVTVPAGAGGIVIPPEQSWTEERSSVLQRIDRLEAEVNGLEVGLKGWAQFTKAVGDGLEDGGIVAIRCPPNWEPSMPDSLKTQSGMTMQICKKGRW